MSLSKRTVGALTVATLAIAGGAFWMAVAPGPEPVPSAPPPRGPAGSTVAGNPGDGKVVPPPATETGVVVGRLVHGVATNAVQGEVTVSLAGRAPKSVRTTGRGSFRIEGLPVETVLALNAEAPGLITARLPDLRIPWSGVLDVGDLELGTGATVEFLVTRGTLRPSEGVVVTLSREPPERRDERLAWTAIGTERFPTPQAEAKTDALGCVRFPGTPPGAWIARAERAGYVAMEMRFTLRDGEPVKPLRMHLMTAHSLSGTLCLPGGAPAAGIEVFARVPGWHPGTPSGDVRAVTGPDGRYRIDGLGVSSNDIFIRSPRGVARWVKRVMIPDLSRLDVTLEGGAESGVTLKGRVVEGAGGTGVAGARVVVDVYERDSWGDGPVTVAAETGADGSFELRGLPTGPRAKARVLKPGYLSSELEGLDAYGSAARGSVIDLTGRLDRGGTVRGTVTDSAGRPLAGVVVRCSPRGSMMEWLRSDDSGGGFARSGEDGTYRISPCVPGKSTLSVRAPGYFLAAETGVSAAIEGKEPVTPSSDIEIAEGGEAVRDLVLATAGIVEGTVTGVDGQPRGGFSVRIQAKGKYDNPARGPVTDAAGKFRVEGVTPGKDLEVIVVGPREKGEARVLDLAAGATLRDVAVTVRPGNVVRGTVRSGDGTPLADPRIYLVSGNLERDALPWQNMTTPGLTNVTTPEPDGSFRFDNVYPSTHSVVAFARGRGPGVFSAVDVKRRAVTEGIEVVLGPGRSLSGTVVDESRNPLAGAEVYLVAHPNGVRTPDDLRQVADADGRFTLTDLVEGTVDLVVRVSGRPEFRKTVETGTDRLVVTVEKGRRISGVVVDAATGEGVPGVQVIVKEPGAEGPSILDIVEKRKRPHTGTSDARGLFSVDDLESGTYAVSAGRGSGTAVSSREYAPLEIKGVKAGTEDLRLEIAAGLSITGAVVDEDGKPILESLPLEVAPLDAKGERLRRRQWTIRTGTGGTFRVPGLRAGSYELTFGNERGRIGSGVSSPFVATVLQEVKAGAQDLVVRIARGLPISGKVVDEDGKPLAGPAMLSILPSKKPDDGSHVRLFAIVEGDGGFTTPALAPGRTYDIEADHFEGVADGVAKGVEPGAKNVVLRLVRGAAISGRLLLPDGRPALHGISVEAQSIEERGVRDDEVSAETMEDGTFRITGLSRTAYAIVAGGDGSDFAPTRVPGPFKPGDSGVEIQLEPGFSISGILVDVDGKPVRDRHLLAMQPKVFGNHSWGRSTGTGSFVVKGLGRGKVKLSVSFGEGLVDVGEFEVPSKDLKITVKSE